MKHLHYLFLYLFCVSCTQKGNDILSTAWETVEKDPQQVISLLDTCSFSRPSHRAQRAWLLSRAYDKCDINIADDSLIMQAVKYYKRTRNQNMYLRSLYCLGRVQLNAGDSYNAMMSFEQTADLARERKDWFWLGLSARNMADIYNDSYCLDKCIQCEKESVYAFTQSGDSLYLAYEQLELARSYHSMGKEIPRDSLLSILLNQPINNHLLLGEIHKTQARAYYLRSYPLYEEAYKHYMLCPREIMRTSDWCNLLVILAGMGKSQDDYTLSLFNQISAIANSSHEMPGIQAKYALYRYHRHAGNYNAALSSFEKAVAYQDSLLRQKIQQSLVLNQKEYYKHKSEKERNLRQMISVFSILGALLLLFAILLLIQRTRQKRKQVEVALSQIDEIQKKYDRLSQDSLQKEIDTLSQLAEDYYNSDDKRQQQSIITHFKNKLDAFRDFDAELSFLEKDINIYRNQAMEHFRAEFPGMSKHAYKMAVVFFAGLPNSLIGLLMNKTTPTVRTERSQLRKKIAGSTAIHKEDYLNLLDSYQRASPSRGAGAGPVAQEAHRGSWS